MKNKGKISIGGILDHSTIDYPDNVCAVVYTCGCPFRCPWCHNKDLVLCKNCNDVGIDWIVSQLKQNFLINSVCITGGEPLMQKDTINLVKEIKNKTKLHVKIDTNGFYPESLKEALPFLDFVSIDIKAALNENYEDVVGLPAGNNIAEKVKQSLNTLKKFKKPKEARTTIVPGLIDSKQDIMNIAKDIKDVKFNIYTLQQFREKTTINPEFEKLPSPKREEILKLGRIAKKELPEVKVRIATEENGFEWIE